MADRVIRAYWDCEHCGTKGIDGLVDVCPACGSGKGKNVRYYMKSVEEVSAEELEAAGISADENDGKHVEWICAYCGSLNNFRDQTCVHCGADRAEKEQDYGGDTSQTMYRRDKDGTLHQTAKPKPEKTETYVTEEDVRPQTPPRKASGGMARFLLPLVAVLGILAFLLWPHTAAEAISGFSWQRSVLVEELQTFSESGWNTPAGARVTGSRNELYGYRDVLDYYRTVYVERTRQVVDHYDTSYEYTDNGNGTFSEREVRTPVYRTETYTEPVQEPVYRKEPIYQTKYYYEVDRWMPVRKYETQGTDHDPYWSREYTLKENQRDISREEVYYTVYDETDQVRTDYDTWKNQSVGDGVYVTSCRLGIEYSRTVRE